MLGCAHADETRFRFDDYSVSLCWLVLSYLFGRLRVGVRVMCFRPPEACWIGLIVKGRMDGKHGFTTGMGALPWRPLSGSFQRRCELRPYRTAAAPLELIPG